jgi:hypothetical protein
VESEITMEREHPAFVSITIYSISVGRICSVGRKGDRITGDTRKLHIDDIHNLYSSPTIIRVIK